MSTVAIKSGLPSKRFSQIYKHGRAHSHSVGVGVGGSAWPTFEHHCAISRFGHLEAPGSYSQSAEGEVEAGTESGLEKEISPLKCLP